ncbi:hypothetical protein C9994_02950 [Marivirga lumbricoides]|uniref:Esterase n=1 Tax=Marivirga lumbricoides TaxID=1046115 RepID=A0A2T4DUB0_9BACT|nr:hypothetical protein C9994_02950 [Marivirga lumbricoides]
MFSKYIQDYRTVKIYLPKDYSEGEKYPTIYTLDGEWMFEPGFMTTKILSDCDVIPKSIVVGIFHKNRNEDLEINWETGEFVKGSSNFFSFLTKELVPKIDSIYSSSGFNVLIGHSNSATFSHKVLTQKVQPFNGVIALSQNLFGQQLQEYIEFTKTVNKPTFYFVASGKRDATPRLESGMKLDSEFKINKNSPINSLHIVYDADHNGIAAKGISNGIAHVFSDYKHYNDWDDNLIDSLIDKNIGPIDFIDQHSEKMKNIYGVNFKVNQDDLSLMSALTENTSDVEKLEEFEIEHFGKSSEFYAMYAQSYEYINDFEKALEYWSIHLEENSENISNFFYYRRPIELLNKKMKQSKRAIEFAVKWKKQAPEYSLFFNYYIATIALENNIKKKVGLDAIKEFIENYNKESGLYFEEAKEIERRLKQ